MRGLVGIYLLIGIVLLALGYFATGPCPNRNSDVLNDFVFVVAWPVYLYGDVIRGTMSPGDWLHAQACQPGGLHGHPGVPAPPSFGSTH